MDSPPAAIQTWDPGPAPVIGPRRAPWRRAASGASSVLLAILLGFAGFVVLLMATGTQPRVEATGSMEPTLSPGDVVFVHEIAAREARVGDIAAFREPGGDRTIVHRVRRIEAAPGGRLSITTRGDANRSSETWQIPADGRMGTVTYHVPFVGRALTPFHKVPWGLLPLVSSVALGGLALRRIWSTP